MQVEARDEGIGGAEVRAQRGRRESNECRERRGALRAAAVRRRGRDQRVRKHLQRGRHGRRVLAEERRRVSLQTGVPHPDNLSYGERFSMDRYVVQIPIRSSVIRSLA